MGSSHFMWWEVSQLLTWQMKDNNGVKTEKEEEKKTVYLVYLQIKVYKCD